jgi:YD repeat-containing protein
LFAATLTYDSLNRLTSVDYGNASVISYTYDAAGNRLTYSGTVSAMVLGRYIFYNNSAFDGNNPAANDDGAIAPDKIALLPGQIATFANYTSYSKGINGIMVDISGLGGTPTAEDFGFKVGNVNNLASWVTAPTPSSITVRSGAGTAGSDRITIIWPDSVIQNRWLEVTVLMTPRTGLASQDVFYFGNAIGETGDGISDCNVLVNDALRILNQMAVGVGISSPFDIDRAGSVLVNDALITLTHMVAGPQALQLIDLSGVAGLVLLC